MDICSGLKEIGCPSFQRRQRGATTHIRRLHAIIERSSRRPGQSLASHPQPTISTSPQTILYPCPTIRTNLLHPDRWINSLPVLFQQCGLEVLDHVTQTPLPIYRKPWNEDCLIGWAAIGDMIESQEEKNWYKELLAEAAENAKKGWYVDWELVICIAKNAV